MSKQAFFPANRAAMKQEASNGGAKRDKPKSVIRRFCKRSRPIASYRRFRPMPSVLGGQIRASASALTGSIHA